MEIALKLCTFAVYILYLMEIIDAQKPCKVPNGDAGICINISKCQPLMELSNVKYKTPHENMYFHQSYCGGNEPRKLKVCCPSKSTWDTFVPRPIIYPHSPTAVPSAMLITKSPVITQVIPQRPVVAPVPVSETHGPRMAPEKLDDLSKNCGKQTTASNKVIGGQETGIDQYPWMALLEYAGNELACGGSLISSRFVLTAAHCIISQYGSPIFARLAEFNITSYPTDYVYYDGGGIENITVQMVRIKKTYPHPQFSRSQKINDIGLLELMENVVITIQNEDFIKAICLPERNFLPDFDALTNFTIAGWGGTANAVHSEVKQELSIPYVPWDRCRKNPDTQICAGGIKGQDSCPGDSGGPLMYEYDKKFYVVGVISYGHRKCGTEGEPAVHTNVYEYMTWIKETMRIKLNDHRSE